MYGIKGLSGGFGCFGVLPSPYKIDFLLYRQGKSGKPQAGRPLTNMQ